MNLVEGQILRKLSEMKAEIAHLEQRLEAELGPKKYNKGKLYVAISQGGTPFILFGRDSAYTFYSGRDDVPISFAYHIPSPTPQEAIDTIWAHDGRVYEFDTIREAMTFFLEHLKEEE